MVTRMQTLASATFAKSCPLPLLLAERLGGICRRELTYCPILNSAFDERACGWVGADLAGAEEQVTIADGLGKERQWRGSFGGKDGCAI